MRRWVLCLSVAYGVVGAWASTAQAQGQPHFKVWATEIYDSTMSIMPCASCPTQSLPSGMVGPGDFINVEVTLEGWDTQPDQGSCDGPTGGTCSVAAQDCAGKHCTNTGSVCSQNSNCVGGADCVLDECVTSPLVGTYQWTLDSSSLDAAGGGPGLAPARQPCTQDTDCRCAYDALCSVNADFLCTCASSTCEPDGFCSEKASAYIDQGHRKENADLTFTEFIFFQKSIFPVIGVSTPDYFIGAALGLGAEPAAEFPAGKQSPYYLGTLFLEVLDSGCGSFDVALKNQINNGVSVETAATDSDGAALPPSIVDSLSIIVPSIGCPGGCNRTTLPCVTDVCNECAGVCEFVEDPNGTACDSDDCFTDQTCRNGVCGSGDAVCPPSCDSCFRGICLPVGCENASPCDIGTHVTDSFPPACAIDARQPHEVGGPGLVQGWDELVLMLDFDPGTGCVAGDFTVTTVPAEAVPPSISSVTADGGAQTLTLVLDRIITPEHWTCVTYDDTGEQWCMGSLPADVNSDGLSSVGDINRLIDCLNLAVAPPCDIWQTDIDRSGTAAPQDILRVIDLLNGANPFANWLTKSLPVCP